MKLRTKLNYKYMSKKEKEDRMQERKRTSVMLPYAYLDALNRIKEKELINPSISIRKALRLLFENYPEIIPKDHPVWKI